MEAVAATDYKTLYEEEKTLRSTLEVSFSQMQLTLSALTHELAQLRKMIYGARSERSAVLSHPSQLTLDMFGGEPAAADNGAADQPAGQITYSRKTDTKKPKNFSHPGRNPLPAHLRREEIIVEPDHVPPGARKIGEEITEELEYLPGELYVNRYVRPKYASPSAADPSATDIIIAPLPVRPLEKALAGPGLLAQVAIDKYIDHIPLHRQMQRFERGGVRLPYSTLTDMVAGTCEVITPVFEAHKRQTLSTGYLHVDETPIRVLDKAKKGRSHQGYMWVYNNSPGGLVLFDYQPTRGSEHPEGMLEQFRGYLQTDGYVGYDSFIDKEGITWLHCMAHARRKFIEAADNDKGRSSYALEQMGRLYALERRCKEEGLNEQERWEQRQSEALPILKELGAWMKEQYVQVLPKSPIGKALGYSLERWERLSLYTTNGMLEIDNNPVEREIRPVAVGRKNYLFCGSHQAAQRTAMLYSLLGTCKLQGINPLSWLKDVLGRIATHPINRISELLPENWQPVQPQTPPAT
jgi:transposase